MILGITEESTNLLHNCALVDHKEFCSPSFIFNYIIGPVNLILKGYREHFQKNRKNSSAAKRSRSMQLLQFELTSMIIEFLIKEYKNDKYNESEQPTIYRAIKYVNEKMPDNTEHIKPNKVSLLCILGYAENFKEAIPYDNPRRRETSRQPMQPFNVHSCHPLSNFNNLIQEPDCSIKDGERCIPDLWDLNKHFDKIRDGRLQWNHVFKYDVFENQELEAKAKLLERKEAKQKANAAQKRKKKTVQKNKR